jgi:hypothetical protein
VRATAVIVAFWIAAPAAAQPARTIDRASYPDRLRGMWLGECIADWTGLTTEGYRNEPPFLTDADWGTTVPGGPHLDFVFQEPWLADDNTDVEYVYLHLMSQHGRCLLTPDEIRDGWLAHMDPAYMWNSNLRAYTLMQRGLRPPRTGMPSVNPFWAAVSCSLTTEFFGSFTPGMPDQGLRYAELPICNTAEGFSLHCAQFYNVLRSLAPAADPGLSGRDKVLWLVRGAREYIPGTSKAADIVDFVLADFLDNPDVNDWERTRDRIYERYQLHADQNGFWYRGWAEAAINFACGVTGLLYGQGDYRRTVQVCTLGGWDSDDPAATMGAVVGLMVGYQALAAQFPGQQISDRYNIHRTRLNLPDYLPQDPEADDTLSMMAARMMPLVDACVLAAGGKIDARNNRWVLPSPPACRPLDTNPGQRERLRSANCRVRLEGGTVTGLATLGSPPGPYGTYGVGNPGMFANGFSGAAFAGLDREAGEYSYYTSMGSGHPTGTVETLTVLYDRPVRVATVRFIEGDHFGTPGGSSPSGGWFTSMRVEARVNGAWVALATVPGSALDPATPFQTIDFALATPLMATGIRVSGPAGGTDGFVTCQQLDALAEEAP